MIDLVSWPPRQYSTFSVRDQPFTWHENEPFVTRLQDGKVDIDPKHLAPGFLNRIYRYCHQNRIPRHEWLEEKILSTIYERVPPSLRGRFFRKAQSNSPSMPLRPNTSPVPPGFAEAAGLAGVADQDPDLPMALAKLNPDDWMKLLHRWMRADRSNRESKTVAGPAFWYAAHTVSLNPVTTFGPPLRFVGQWLGTFPCRHCRIESRRYVARVPVPGWDGFEQWMNDFHTYVTSRKK